MQSNTLLPVSRKKQVTRPLNQAGLLWQTSTKSPAHIPNFGSSPSCQAGATSGTFTLLKASSQLSQWSLACMKGYIVNCQADWAVLMMKLDPNSMKQVTQLPSTAKPALTNSKTNRPSPHPGTRIRLYDGRYCLHFSTRLRQSFSYGLSEHHSRQNCLIVLLSFDLLLTFVQRRGSQWLSYSITLMYYTSQLRNA